MGDYCDGEQYQEHPLFQNDPCAIQVRLYYDNLEVCNALGSKTKKHKLGNNNQDYIVVKLNLCTLIGLFYYTIGNIDPKFRSAIHTIQLVAVVKTTLISKYGINQILKPFMDEINVLESVSSHLKLSLLG